jgi:hypothetical protein
MADPVGGYTNMTRDRSHGTQIEYVSPRGKTYLWYPGNAVILEGRWKLKGPDICFAYGANSYNPATGARGGGWECMPYKLHWGSIVERMPGDPLGLERRNKVPFKLSRTPTTLEKVLARVSPRTKAPPLEVPVVGPNGALTLSCQSIIANAERSKSDMSMASTVYFHGKFMGKACVEVDYVRAFELAKRAGMSVEPYLRLLRARAASGNPRANTALQLLGR